MSHALKRVQRLRRLMEEISRVELEARAQRKRVIEDTVSAWKDVERGSRVAAFHSVNGSDIRARMVAEASSALALWHGEQLAPVVHRVDEALEVSRDIFLDRRKERHQVEIVLEAAAIERAREMDRQQQRALDDWFSLRRMQQKRRARKLASTNQTERT